MAAEVERIDVQLVDRSALCERAGERPHYGRLPAPAGAVDENAAGLGQVEHERVLSLPLRIVDQAEGNGPPRLRLRKRVEADLRRKRLEPRLVGRALAELSERPAGGVHDLVEVRLLRLRGRVAEQRHASVLGSE